MNASGGMSTLPNCRMRFLPSFCFSSSFRLRGHALQKRAHGLARDDFPADRCCGSAGQRASPSRMSSARLSWSPVDASIDPRTLRIRSLRKASILSVMICDRPRSPLPGAAGTIGHSGNRSVISDVSGQTRMVSAFSLKLSACTTTAGRGLPRSACTARTMSPRFIAIRASRRPARSSHPARRPRQAARAIWPGGADRTRTFGSRRSGTQY